MKTVTELPQDIEELEHVWVALPDGTRLAARIWLPASAREQPVPAILEYLPYRKRDGTRQRDEQHLPYFAGHGLAAVRVDLRGSGDSDGVLTDEYLEQELADGEQVLAWIAAQPWCDGRVGMMGISWGGFNALQIAARRPPELKAVVAVAATDDRYADDVHYMGGCLLADNLSWASTMFAYNSLPPDPQLRDDWRERWFERLDGSGLWLASWLEHQHRDDYWRHGSICEDWGAIDVPVMIVSGWADGYTNAVFRVLEHLDVPRVGLVGPWSHKYPHQGIPGPAIGWLQECVQWWDRWLGDEDNGIEQVPMLRTWMQDSVPPFGAYAERPGRWVSEPSWPSPNVRWQTRRLAPERILPEGREPGPDDDWPRRVQSPLSVGLFAGKWCSYATGPDLPGDQREEDGGALVFDSEPLQEPLEILGPPVVELEVASDQPVAMVAVRLSDVRPNGQVTRVTYGLLNLTHRDSHAEPTPLPVGEAVRVRVQLNDIAHHFPAGHRIRVAVSTSYWPLAWLPPQPTLLTMQPARSLLHLPERPLHTEVETRFAPSESSPPPATTVLAPEEHAWRVLRDLETDTSTLEVLRDDGAVRFDDLDLVMRIRALERYSVVGDDVTSARGETIWDRGLERGDWRVSTRTRTLLTCDQDAFVVHAELDAFEGAQRVFSKNWDERIPRRLV